MEKIIQSLLPNLAGKVPELYESFLQTVYMVGISGLFAFSIGIVLGVVLIVTRENAILENKVVHSILEKIINTFRSIPFIILLAALIPLTRYVVGTAIGTQGAILPLVFGTVPFFSRQVESALADLDDGLVEAAQSMGSSPLEIIFRVYLRESIANIVRVIVITIVNLLGLTAMAGAIGGGGLGDFAIRYGHQRNQVDITYVTVIVLLVMVNLIQGLGSIIIKKTTH